MQTNITLLNNQNILFLQIELKGQVDFITLLGDIFQRELDEIKIIKADLEYFGKKSFGKLVVQLNQNIQQVADLYQYLDFKKINYSIINLN